MISESFQRDYKVVKQGVVSLLTNEGTNPEGLEQQIENISMAYMVGLKAQWLKVSPKNVATFLTKYQEVSTIAMQLLEKHDFVSLVKTYRKVNLSPKTKKVLCGIDRYQDFVNKVNDGTYKVVSIDTKPKPKKQVNSFTNAFINPQPKVVKASKVAKQPKAKVVKQPKPKAKALEGETIYDSSVGLNRFEVATKSGNGKWVQVFKDEYLKDRALVRVVKDNNKSLFGRFLYIKSRKGKKEQFFRIVTKSAKFVDININDISMVLEFEPVI